MNDITKQHTKSAYYNKIIHVPDGEKYGFPKKCLSEDDDLTSWLIEQGIPEESILEHDFHIIVSEEIQYNPVTLSVVIDT
jgi:hypothetical protein